MPGMLTRAEMEQIIADGGSVLINSSDPNRGSYIASRVDMLPDEVDLVAGDELRRRTLADSLDQQIANLASQRAKLDAEPPAPPAPPSGEATQENSNRRTVRGTAAARDENSGAEQGSEDPGEQHPDSTTAGARDTGDGGKGVGSTKQE